MTTNPIDRLPLAFKVIRDFVITFVVQKSFLLLIFLIGAIAILLFANSRDFNYVCDSYELGQLPVCNLK